MAVDTAGNVYVTDTPLGCSNWRRVEHPGRADVHGAERSLGTAVNIAGDVYVTDCDVTDGRDSRVLKTARRVERPVELPFSG